MTITVIFRAEKSKSVFKKMKGIYTLLNKNKAMIAPHWCTHSVIPDDAMHLVSISIKKIYCTALFFGKQS